MNLVNSRYASIFGKEYKQIGPFRFPVLRSLTAAERQVLQDLQRKNAESGLTLFSLAERLKREKGLPMDQALQVLQDPNPEKSELLQGYAAEMLVILRNTESAMSIKSQLVTTCLSTRGEFQNEEGGWESTYDWTAEMTRSLPESLVDQIHAFLLVEQNGGKAPAKPKAEPKSGPKPESNKSRKRSKPAGESSQSLESTGETITEESSSPE